MRPRMCRPACVGVLFLLVVAVQEAAAQAPVRVVPPPRPLGQRLRSLGREFVDDLRYPFRAVPEAFEPTPPYVTLRPNYEGRLVPTPVPPQPVKPLFLSGYAGARPPEPRAGLIPTARHGHLHPAARVHGGLDPIIHP